MAPATPAPLCYVKIASIRGEKRVTKGKPTNIAWAKYDRADWQRVPGKARNYSSKANPNVVISRRQFDEHYGSAAMYGTYEKKAKLKASEPESPLRPARGRKSAKKLTGAEREAEANRRRVIKRESEIDKTIAKLHARKLRYPKKITLKTFKHGWQLRGFDVPVDTDAIDAIRASAARSGFVFAYTVGLTLVSERSGSKLTPSLDYFRDIHKPFTAKDMDDAVEMATNKATYSEWVGMWMKLKLTRAAAKRNGKRFKDERTLRP